MAALTSTPTGAEGRNHRRAGGQVEAWNPGSQEWEPFTTTLGSHLDQTPQPGLRLRERPTKSVSWYNARGYTVQGYTTPIAEVGRDERGIWWRHSYGQKRYLGYAQTLIRVYA